MITAEIPLPVLLTLLEAPRPSNLQYVLRSLHLAQQSITHASKGGLTLLTSRVNNLLQARDDYKRWYGSHVVQVLAHNPVVLTNAGAMFIVSLLKIINESNTVSINLKNASLALEAIVKGIRGKPVLTREVLTPNLPPIIGSLLDNIDRDVVTILPILQKLLLKHTTTFKPFVKKFEAKLTKMLVENYGSMNSQLQADVCKSYAYLSLVKPTGNGTTNGGAQPLPDDQWRAKLLQIMDEIRSTVLIYDNFIDLKSERDAMDIIKQLPNLEKKEYIFPFLKVDLSEPITVVSISQRLKVLVGVLTAFVTSATPFPIRVPLGLVVQVANLLLGISPNYIPFKGELRRDQDLKKIIMNDMVKSQSIGARLILQLVKFYKKLVLPHLSAVLSSLEVAIPVKSDSGKKLIKVDKEAVLSIEAEVLTVLQTVTEILKLFDGLNEFELINKLVEASMVLLEKRTPMDKITEKQQQAPNQQGQGQKNKKKKNKDSTPLSDLLSHAELFELNPPRTTISTIAAFFDVVIKKIPQLSPTYRIKMTKYIITISVKQESLNGEVTPEFMRLLESLVLYPGASETYSVLPIVKRLLPNNEKLSLLTNPRFPVLDVKYRPQAEVIEEIEDDEEKDKEEDRDEPVMDIEEKEEEARETVAEELKRVHIAPPVSKPVFKTQEEMQTLSFPTSEVPETGSLTKTRSLEDEEDTPSKRIKITETSTSVEVDVKIDESEGDDSDFEVPDIAIGSDDDDEDEE